MMPRVISSLRAAVIVAGFTALSALAGAGAALAATDAASFVSDLGKRAIDVLTSTGSQQQREQQFRKLFDEGFDMEALRPVPDAEQIVDRFMSPSERAEFHSLPGDQKPRAFFHCWTQKEAFIKAVGDGLSLPLDRFDVRVAPDKPAGLLRIDGDSESARHWLMQSLYPAPGFLGALACDRPHALVLWEWNGSEP